MVGNTNTPNMNSCSAVPFHTIIVDLKTEPVGESGISWTYPCYNSADDTEWGATIEIDKEYWDSPGWFSGSSKDTLLDYSMIWDATAHELGHAIGLAHPNSQDSAGKDIPFSCVKNSSGWTPLMCSPYGGPNNNAGINYTAYDIAGMKQLVKNFALAAPAEKAAGKQAGKAMPMGSGVN